MALVFHRGLVLPLWAMVFLTVALTAPPPDTVSDSGPRDRRDRIHGRTVGSAVASGSVGCWLSTS
jgi:hypothetical protein